MWLWRGWQNKICIYLILFFECQIQYNNYEINGDYFVKIGNTSYINIYGGFIWKTIKKTEWRRILQATATKPLNHAFVLKSDKAEAFLNQDNSNFKKVMEKFEKFTNKKCHSKSEK